MMVSYPTGGAEESSRATRTSNSLLCNSNRCSAGEMVEPRPGSRLVLAWPSPMGARIWQLCCFRYRSPATEPFGLTHIVFEVHGPLRRVPELTSRGFGRFRLPRQEVRSRRSDPFNETLSFLPSGPKVAKDLSLTPGPWHCTLQPTGKQSITWEAVG